MVFIDTLVGGFNLSVEYKRWSAKSFFRNCWTKLTSKLLALGLLTDINCGNVDNLQKQLRRIYDSTLDRRPLSGKVFWRKILELKKKTDVKWLQMSQKRKSEKEGNMSENFGYLRLWWDWISCDLSVPLNSGQVIWLLSFPIHVLFWIFWNSYVYFLTMESDVHSL